VDHCVRARGADTLIRTLTCILASLHTCTHNRIHIITHPHSSVLQMNLSPFLRFDHLSLSYSLTTLIRAGGGENFRQCQVIISLVTPSYIVCIHAPAPQSIICRTERLSIAKVVRSGSLAKVARRQTGVSGRDPQPQQSQPLHANHSKRNTLQVQLVANGFIRRHKPLHDPQRAFWRPIMRQQRGTHRCCGSKCSIWTVY